MEKSENSSEILGKYIQGCPLGSCLLGLPTFIRDRHPMSCVIGKAIFTARLPILVGRLPEHVRGRSLVHGGRRPQTVHRARITRNLPPSSQSLAMKEFFVSLLAEFIANFS